MCLTRSNLCLFSYKNADLHNKIKDMPFYFIGYVYLCNLIIKNKNMIEKMNLQTRIFDWAEKAVSSYLELVHDGFNYGFYTQSDLRTISESPDYFIIQINPGSGGCYEAQINNSGWHLDGHDMDAPHFIQGNYFCESGKESSWKRRCEWNNFNKLRSLFSLIPGHNPLDNEQRFVLTNASCFNTPTAPEVYKTLPYTIPILMKLIEVVKPKRIIVLGCKLPPYLKQTEKSVVINESPYKRIKYGAIKGIETLYIDHPSARFSKKDTKQILSLWDSLSLNEIMNKAVSLGVTPSSTKVTHKLNRQNVEELINKHYGYCSNDSQHPYWHFPLGDAHRLCVYGKKNLVYVFCSNNEIIEHPEFQNICNVWRTKYCFEQHDRNKHFIGIRKISDYIEMGEQAAADAIIEAFDAFIAEVRSLDFY